MAWEVGVKSIKEAGANGKLTGVKTVMVDWSKPGERAPFTEVLGSEKVWPADLVLLAMGCFMDTASAIPIAAPLLKPIAEAHGIGPTHLGIIMILNLEIGILTPPLGLNLIVAMTAFKENFGVVCRAAIPFVLLISSVCC